MNIIIEINSSSNVFALQNKVLVKIRKEMIKMIFYFDTGNQQFYTTETCITLI